MFKFLFAILNIIILHNFRLQTCQTDLESIKSNILKNENEYEIALKTQERILQTLNDLQEKYKQCEIDIEKILNENENINNLFKKELTTKEETLESEERNVNVAEQSKSSLDLVIIF